MKVNKDKKYKTRDGREVRVYATDMGGEYPVHGAWKDDDVWVCDTWRDDGGYHYNGNGESETDLVEVEGSLYSDALKEAAKKWKPFLQFSPPHSEKQQPASLSLTQHGNTTTIQYSHSHLSMEELSEMFVRLIYGSGYDGDTLAETLIEKLEQWVGE